MDDQKNQNEPDDAKERWNRLAAVANLYYNQDLTQNQIAERMYTSRSKISRMLKEARDLGIVDITIREPWDRDPEAERQFRERFSLKNIRVIDTKTKDEEESLGKLAEAAAYYLDAAIKEGMTVGISWGSTLYSIVSRMNAGYRKNIPITVVPIMGAANIRAPQKDVLDLTKGLASVYGGIYRYLYAPLFVKSRELKENLMQEENIREVLDLARTSDLILTSVGSFSPGSWRRYMSDKTMETLQAKGAVGHLGGHFYNRDGQELKSSLPERMIGLTLDEISACPEVVCVACGAHKAAAVVGALSGGYIDTLIVDEACAKGILEA